MTTTVRVTRHFDASAERVFDAWLDPTRARKWLYATPSGEMQEFELDARVGGGFRIVERRAGQDFAHVGHYLALERPRLLQFTISAGISGQELSPKTTVTVEIIAHGESCELTLTHEGVFADFEARTKAGWATLLDGCASAA